MTTLIKESDLIGFDLVNPDINIRVGQIIQTLAQTEEMRRLSYLVEKNPYHDSEKVLEHLQRVFVNSQELVKMEFVKDQNLKNKYMAYLSKKIDQFSRRDILVLASGIHDIGKGVEKTPGHPYLEVIDEEGNTRASGHEHAGAVIIPSLLRDSGLSSQELTRVQQLVELHDTYSEIFCKSNLKLEASIDMPVIRKQQPDMHIDLLLHIISDNWGVEIYRRWSEYFLQEIFNLEN